MVEQKCKNILFQTKLQTGLFLTNFDQFLRSNDPAICHYFVGLPAAAFASKRPLTLHLFFNILRK